MSSETVRSNHNSEWSQGDILRFSDRDGKGPKFGFIINADCDLANGKNDGVISYLPIYSLRAYLEKYWLPSFLRSERANRISSICQDLGIPKSERSDFEDWIVEAGCEPVVSELISERPLKPKVENRVQLNSRFFDIAGSDEGIEVLAALAETQDNSTEYLIKNLSNGLKGLDDSSIFINEIIGESELGFVIRVNRILSLEEAMCHRYRPDFLSHDIDPEMAERTAKFSDLFRFKIIQTFGSQFTRVGTDDFFKHAAQIAIDELGERLLGRTN